MTFKMHLAALATAIALAFPAGSLAQDTVGTTHTQPRQPDTGTELSIQPRVGPRPTVEIVDELPPEPPADDEWTARDAQVDAIIGVIMLPPPDPDPRDPQSFAADGPEPPEATVSCEWTGAACFIHICKDDGTPCEVMESDALNICDCFEGICYGEVPEYCA